MTSHTDPGHRQDPGDDRLAEEDSPALWARQTLTVAAYGITGVLFRRRSLPLYLLVGMPVLTALLFALFPDNTDLVWIQSTFAYTFLFIIRFVVFFGCAGVFVHAIRGEILDRSIHYTLLLPIRREVVVVGKYLGGLVASLLVCLPATAAVYLLMHLPLGTVQLSQHLWSGPGFGHLFLYLFIVVLACIGYGAVFLTGGLLFKNPMIPAGLFLLWESATPFLPPVLKAFSILHYLGSLTPVPVELGPLAIMVQPVSPWIAVPGLVGFAVLMLVVSGLVIRRLEVSYAAE